MKFVRSVAVASIVLVPSMSAGYAGPCSQEISRIQTLIDAKLEGAAGGGSSGVESNAATLHRQPTPRSIATAEVGLGTLSKEQAEAVGAAMTRAREADNAGDQAACEQALSDARHALNQ